MTGAADHTGAILDFAGADHVLPANIRAGAERLLADTLAVGAAGAHSAEAAKLRNVFQREGGAARMLSGGRTAPGEAALFNGFAIHCLEWDAVHEGAVVHALSVVTAALLAQSDAQGGSEREAFLTALAIGVDIASGMGLAATEPMQFFRPATAGVIGASLACARLAELPRDRMGDVLGLAYSFAGGTMQAHVEASLALPLQIGNAARCAVTAVALAEAGMDGPQDALEGPFGYSKLIEPLDLERYIADIGSKWRIGEVAVKPFPSGRASHGALGELEKLHRGGWRPGDVESIELFAPPLIERLVARPYKPSMSAAYARLCLGVLAPVMLRDGNIDPALFDGDALYAPELAELAPRVAVSCDGNPDGNAMTPQRLVITCKNGEVIERRIDASLGSPASPMNDEQSAAKRTLARRHAGHSDARIFEAPLSYATEPQ
ncbi:MmgE/PrpD family protein [Erythrobacter sp.]|uniref:MmgE/PrpD family protein n=1 Tax=Erythrobacter sp. TaxID=1042 RepID=UPI002EBE8D49|nr:MmgE/PrpD family protein [Erythrobacter sp.]